LPLPWLYLPSIGHHKNIWAFGMCLADDVITHLLIMPGLEVEYYVGTD
jgi:hypothetical protein